MLLKPTIEKLENAIQYCDKEDHSVSAREVGWHIDHSLKVIISVCEALKNSDPQQFTSSFRWNKFFVMLTGYIPRGKAKAPSRVVNNGKIDEKDLKAQATEAKSLLQEIEQLPANSYFPHPYFGNLNLKEGVKFLKIHTIHHQKIIDNILAPKF